MDFKPIVFLLLSVLTMVACQNKQSENDGFSQLPISDGNFLRAESLLVEELKAPDLSNEMKDIYEIQLETLSRIRKEFPYSRAEIKTQLEKYYPDVADAELDEWEAANQLEMRVIDGEKRYFKRAVGNFFRLNADAKKLKESLDGESYDGVKDFQVSVIPGYFENEIKKGKPFDRRRIKVDYTIRLKPNQVPAGETVRCWLPYPRINLARLTKVELLGTSENEFVIAPESQLQRTIYMEKAALEDSATVFHVSYIFDAAAQWFGVDPAAVEAYDKSSARYKRFTAERLPHIILNDTISSLAKQIVGTETNPAKQVELVYYWLNDNIPWAGALEYSTMECIPEYVLEHGKGDCGMQTFLFLSLARSLGIPCKWQSGWYLLPQEKNLHDWAEVYYQGIGWVPVDPSFKLIDSDDKRVKEFYMNGLDSYRLIVNDDYSQELFPPKTFYRSEPYDFQRGELEWEGGNLYFDTWSYKIEVEYLN